MSSRRVWCAPRAGSALFAVLSSLAAWACLSALPVGVGGVSLRVYNSSDCSGSSLLATYSHDWPSLGQWDNARNLTCALSPADTTLSSSSPYWPSVQYYCGVDDDGNHYAQINTFSSATNCSSRQLASMLYVDSAAPGNCSAMWFTDYSTRPSSGRVDAWAVLNCTTAAATSSSNGSSPNAAATPARLAPHAAYGTLMLAAVLSAAAMLV